ncbi:MAG TPA: hypothetical protein VJM09_05185 [Sphingobium sp.]|nr:hypothetical protein [Sphingobium sp.]
MSDRYPAHVPSALAEVLGQPPYQLHVWWNALREVGVEVPTRYEGEVAAALHFLVPFAIRSPEDWRGAAAEELLRIRDGKRFTPQEIKVYDPSNPPSATDLAERAFGAIQEDAPPDVPQWNDLHELERRHLLAFAAELIRLVLL